MFNSLRGRLTLSYLAALSAVLILFSAGVFLFVDRTLHERMDANLLSTLQITTAALASNAPSNPADGSWLAEGIKDPRFPGQMVALLDSDGRVLARRPAGSTLPLRLPSLPLRSSASPQFYDLPESKPDADDSTRGVYQRLAAAPGRPTYFLVVTGSSELIGDQLDALENVLIIAIVLALLLAGSVGWLIVRKGLAPVAAMAAATERITAENLDDRVPVMNREDELGRLATRFNDLLSRLSQSFSQQRQFMADASHELRTPLSVIRTAAQVALQKPERPEEEYRQALNSIEQQTQRLGRIVNDMFTLARADSGGIVIESEEMYLDEVLGDAAKTISVLAKRKNIHLEMPDIQEAPYRGDESLLRQMFINLLDNAIKYTPEGGLVRVLVEREESEYRVIISDTGVGIPVEAQPYIFDRFFRADTSRTQTMDVNGAGLGLSIARWIAEVHKGCLKLQHSDSTGTTFSISLPRS